MEEKTDQKAILRRRILKKRNELPTVLRREMDRLILENLIRYDETDPCSVYLCYVNYKSEVSTKEFILWCLNKGKTVFVPKVKAEAKPEEMAFYRMDSLDELKAGYQGIPEPKELSGRAFPGWLAGREREAECKNETIRLRMLLPGAVFDKSGNRIGYGGGFYDRWLAKWEEGARTGKLYRADREAGKKMRCTIEKIGIAYGIQVVDEIAAEDFDKKVDLVLTEKRWRNEYESGITM